MARRASNKTKNVEKKMLNVELMTQADSKKYSEKKVVDVHGFTVEVDKVFKPSKIAMLFQELLEKQDYANKTGLRYMFELDPSAYVMLLMVKYFTSIDIPDSLEDQLKVLSIMVDNDFLAPIVGAFDESEIVKVKDFINNAVENTVQRLRMKKEEAEKVISEYSLTDEEVINKIESKSN